MGKRLYLQVLAAIALGIAIGHFFPHFAESCKPLGDLFIKLIKMIIAPIVFCTVVVGIAGMGDVKKVGRVGGKAILYFEILSTLALFIGLGVVLIVQPGSGIHADLRTLDTKGVPGADAAKQHGFWAFLLEIVPTTVVDAFAKGDILQVLVFAVLFGLALAKMGQRGKRIIETLDEFGHAFFGIVGIVMRLAPIGAFGAMAFTVGKYGLGTIVSLGKLMACFYVTCLLFVFIVLGLVMRWCGGSIFRLLKYLGEELAIVLGTSSSESVLPRLMDKLEALGCSRRVVGLVVPAGYSFNLDGTSIYLTMAAMFVAQATDTTLTLGEKLTLLGVLLLTSKGAAGVTGSGFVTLAATLATVGKVPVAGLALILGIDRFMSEARALTNLVGNAVATIVVAKWEGELDVEKLQRTLTPPASSVREAPAST
ncbi:MAG: dicarboxylate/amino acid:cation symporter [Polyangiales bacterium]